MERDVEIELAGLKATVDIGFTNIDRRFDTTDLRLGQIETQVRLTNGTVGRHDERIATLFRRVKAGVGGLTIGDLTRYVVIVVATVSVTVGVLRTVGWGATPVSSDANAIRALHQDLVLMLQRVEDATLRQEQLQQQVNTLHARPAPSAASPTPTFSRSDQFAPAAAERSAPGGDQ
jgi:hypothetical protein